METFHWFFLILERYLKVSLWIHSEFFDFCVCCTWSMTYFHYENGLRNWKKVVYFLDVVIILFIFRILRLLLFVFWILWLFFVGIIYYLACNMWVHGSASKESASNPNGVLHEPQTISSSSSSRWISFSCSATWSTSPKLWQILQSRTLTARISNWNQIIASSDHRPSETQFCRSKLQTYEPIFIMVYWL